MAGSRAGSEGVCTHLIAEQTVYFALVEHMMKPIGLFIFDLDGTLVNSLGDLTASVNHTLAHFGKQPLAEDTVRQYVGNGMRALIERSLGGLEYGAEAVALFKGHYRRNLVVHSTLYPSVRETLEFFKMLPLAVVTNKSREFCGPVLDRFGIARYFRVVIGGDDDLPLKPAPDAVFKLMEEYKVPKERTVIVGDSITDIQTGKAAGIVTCAVTYGFRSVEELSPAGPDYIIHQFSDLKKVFTPLMR